MPHHSTTCGLALLLLTFLTLPAAELPAQPPESLPPGWDNVTRALWKQIPGYQRNEAPDNPNKYWWNRDVGTVHVDNATGDLYAMLCQHWGTYRSSDTGETWQLADHRTANGRHVQNRAICADPITGNFAVFKVHGGVSTAGVPVVPQSAIVLDRGRTWLPVTNPGEGFRCGMVDWSQDSPSTILAIRHHYHGPSLFLSEDAGRSWREIPHHGGYGAAMLDANTIVLAFPPGEANTIEGRKVDAKEWRRWLQSQPKDIKLTTDQGRTFRPVGRFNPKAETPARHGDDLFWIAAEGVMVSRDRGRSWQIMGQPLPNLMYGPFFGQNRDSLMVVTREAFFITENAGKTWTRVTDMIVPGGNNINLAHPGWDSLRGIVYVGFLGGDVYRFRIPKS